jgi:uncharacterized membrane protein (UPF0127 family)
MNNLIKKNKCLLWSISLPLISGYILYNYYNSYNKKSRLEEWKNLEIKFGEDTHSDSDSQTTESVFSDIDSNKINIFCHYFNTTYKLEHGFKNRDHLPENEVGLFDMGFYNNHSMWMKDTLIPLDLIFLDRDYKVVGIIKDAEPLSSKSLFVNKMSYYIIEANAGFCDRYSIKVEDTITDKFNILMTL